MNRNNLLVETSWLQDHLRDADVRIVDMRGYVRTTEHEGVQEAEYAGAREEYEQGHIPGAVYIDWTRDIVDPDDSVEAQIAPPQRFAEAMSRLGIGDNDLVIAYDAHPASQFATRLWWALNYYGHKRAAVLNGGWRKWVREQRPQTSEIPRFLPATFTPRVRPKLRATAEDVLAQLGKPGVTLIDARDAGQYGGSLVRKHGRAGHIPGAVNVPREELLDPANGTFRSDEELRQVFSRAHISPDQHIVAYCNGGVAATSVLFSLALLGYPTLTNYDGSWNEWGSRQDVPTEL